jgi:plasmid stability protein
MEAAMATMTLKNVPDELYEQLKRRAERHRRSVNKEAITCLELALGRRADAAGLLEEIRAGRAQMRNLHVNDEDLRTARDEGRP